MPAIVLENSAGEMLGFLLLEATPPLDDGEVLSDCVLTGIPAQPGLFNDPLSEFIQDNKSVEFQSTIKRVGQQLSIFIQVDDQKSLRLAFQGMHVGTWQVLGG